MQFINHKLKNDLLEQVEIFKQVKTFLLGQFETPTRSSMSNLHLLYSLGKYNRPAVNQSIAEFVGLKYNDERIMGATISLNNINL